MFINYLNDVVAERAFSRKLEQEADSVGLKLMATAGYDPRAALDLWELMKCVEEDAVSLGKSVNAENKFGFLRTHPTSEERMESLQGDMKGAMRLWKEHAPRRPKKVELKKASEGTNVGASVSSSGDREQDKHNVTKGSPIGETQHTPRTEEAKKIGQVEGQTDGERKLESADHTRTQSRLESGERQV